MLLRSSILIRKLIINPSNLKHFCNKSQKHEQLQFVNRTADGVFVPITEENHEPNRSSIFSENTSEKAIVSSKVDRQALLREKLGNALKVYEELSGLNDLREAQNKVIEYQERLKIAQETRREIAFEQAQVRSQLQELHSEIQRCNRGDRRYVELVQQEYSLIQKEREKGDLFNIVDNEEREVFTHLTNSVKISHEKERLQAENTKYWSIIASLIGAFLGISATLIGYYYRNNQFERMNNSLTELEHNFKLSNQKVHEFIEKLYQKEREREAKLNVQPSTQSQESWGGYFWRKSVGVYRYFIPKHN